MTSISQMNRDNFVATFGGVYEHSGWIAELVWDGGLTKAEDSAVGLQAAMADVVSAAGYEPQLALLCAHPDLAGKLAVRGDLTDESTSEQASAGLDRCSTEEFDELQALNTRYRSTFNFPYILAVKGRNVPEILENFRSRVDNDIEIEFQEALRQVHQIAQLRLETLLA